MSNLQRMNNASYGIETYLRKQGIDVSGKGKKVNKIMVEFLKSRNLPYVQWNNKYKGLYTPNIRNAPLVQANFLFFQKFVRDNY